MLCELQKPSKDTRSFLLNSPPLFHFYLASVSGKSVPIKIELKITKSWIFPPVTRLQKASDNSFKSLNWKLITPLNPSFHLVNRHTQNERWFYHCHAWNVHGENQKLFLVSTLPWWSTGIFFKQFSTSTVTSAFWIWHRSWIEINASSKKIKETCMYEWEEEKNTGPHARLRWKLSSLATGW